MQHAERTFFFQSLIDVTDANGVREASSNKKGWIMHLHTRKSLIGIGGWLSVGACQLVGVLCLSALLNYAPEFDGQRCPLAGSTRGNMAELGDVLMDAGMTGQRLHGPGRATKRNRMVARKENQ